MTMSYTKCAVETPSAARTSEDEDFLESAVSEESRFSGTLWALTSRRVETGFGGLSCGFGAWCSGIHGRIDFFSSSLGLEFLSSRLQIYLSLVVAECVFYARMFWFWYFEVLGRYSLVSLGLPTHIRR